MQSFDFSNGRVFAGDPVKKQYDFSNGERGKFFRRAVRLVPPQTAEAKLLKERGYQCVLLPDDCRLEGTEMRAAMFGKKVILTPIKKKMRPPPSGRRPSTRLTRDFRETVRARAERDPAFNAKLGGNVRLWRRKQTRTRAPKL